MVRTLQHSTSSAIVIKQESLYRQTYVLEDRVALHITGNCKHEQQILCLTVAENNLERETGNNSGCISIARSHKAVW